MTRMRAVVLCAFTLVAVASLSDRVIAQQSDAARNALESAAAKGSAPAQYALGAAAEAADDFAQALERYGQAAEQGYAAAQFKIGELYEHGKTVEADKAQAIEWYQKAAAQGLTQAITRLEELDPVAPFPVAVTTTEQPSLEMAPRADEPATAIPPLATISTASPSSLTSVTANRTNELETTTASAGAMPGRLFWGVTFVEGIILWLILRALLMGWYRSGTWVYSGSNSAEILTAQVSNRVGFEKWSLYLGFGIAFVSNFVLWMWWSGEFK